MDLIAGEAADVEVRLRLDEGDAIHSGGGAVDDGVAGGREVGELTAEGVEEGKGSREGGLEGIDDRGEGKGGVGVEEESLHGGEEDPEGIKEGEWYGDSWRRIRAVRETDAGLVGEEHARHLAREKGSVIFGATTRKEGMEARK